MTHDLFAIVLAAGSASRFGSAKQLARYRGKPLVRHALDAAEAVCGEASVLVTGFDGAAVYQSAAPLCGFRVHNAEYARGLASSIGAGVAAVAHAADGVILMLADQPLVGAPHVDALAGAWRQAPRRIIATAYGGTAGVPAVFPRDSFAALCALEGDRGAKGLIESAGDSLVLVDFEGAAVDVDRPRDLARIRHRFPNSR